MHKKHLAIGLCSGLQGSIQAPPDPLAGFKGATLWQGRESGEGTSGRRDHPPTTNSWICHCAIQ